MKRVMRFIVYMMPLIVVFLGELLVETEGNRTPIYVPLLAFGELLVETEGNRAQIYVPLLALFPFLYFLQGMLIAFYGGNMHVAVVMTSIAYAITLWLFLTPASWIMVLIYMVIVLLLGLFLEMRHKH